MTSAVQRGDHSDLRGQRDSEGMGDGALIGQVPCDDSGYQRQLSSEEERQRRLR